MINIKISLIYWLFPYPDREIPGNEPGNQVATIPATDRHFQAIHSFGSSNWRHSSSLSSTNPSSLPGSSLPETSRSHPFCLPYIEYSEDVSKSIAQSIAGALTSDRSAVCEGYAKVMQLLMNYYDITNIYVTGTAGGGGHAWNLVRMNNGGYYWLDATWDDQIYEAYQHRYFLVGNNTFVDHVPDGPAGTKTDFLYELPEVSMEDYVYEPIEGVKGDIDQDGNITLKDLLKCLDHVSGNRLLERNAKYYADMDGNGEVDLKDLLRLLDYVSGAKDVL